VKRLLERCALPSGRWLEPGAGEGNIIRAVNRVRQDVSWSAVELREECRPKLSTLVHQSQLITTDFLKGFTYQGSGWDVSITNPAFSIAQEYIEKTLTLAKWSVHLLRLNYLGTEGRNEFFQNNMPDIYVIPDRVSFAKSLSCRGALWPKCDWAEIVELTTITPAVCPRCGGKIRISSTDSIEYAWFVWGPSRNRRAGNIQVLAHTPLHERQALLEAA
jgi:hypothetical protein